MTKITAVKTLAYAFLLIIVIGGLIGWLIWNGGRQRDLERLADLKIIQAQLAGYYSRFSTYQVEGCSIGQAAAKCFPAIFSGVDQGVFNDPINSDNYQYIISEMSATDFGLSFSLERGVGDLPAGSYMLAKAGVRR